MEKQIGWGWMDAWMIRLILLWGYSWYSVKNNSTMGYFENYRKYFLIKEKKELLSINLYLILLQFLFYFISFIFLLIRFFHFKAFTFFTFRSTKKKKKLSFIKILHSYKTVFELFFISIAKFHLLLILNVGI